MPSSFHQSKPRSADSIVALRSDSFLLFPRDWEGNVPWLRKLAMALVSFQWHLVLWDSILKQEKEQWLSIPFFFCEQYSVFQKHNTKSQALMTRLCKDGEFYWVRPIVSLQQTQGVLLLSHTHNEPATKMGVLLSHTTYFLLLFASGVISPHSTSLHFDQILWLESWNDLSIFPAWLNWSRECGVWLSALPPWTISFFSASTGITMVKHIGPALGLCAEVLHEGISGEYESSV